MGEEDPKLRHFSAWQEEELLRYARENVAYMAERNPITEREASQAALFYYEAITALLAGQYARTARNTQKHSGYRPFSCAKGYAYE